MKIVFRVGILLLACVVLSGAARADFADCRCVVREVVRVHSPAEFSCRVERFAGVENLKLRVFVRGVEFSGEAAEIRVKEEKLKELLSGAEVLELKNIQDRGYFRLMADVKADGVDVKEYLEGKTTPQRSQVGENSSVETRNTKQILNSNDLITKTDFLSIYGGEGLSAEPRVLEVKGRLSNGDVERLLGATADLSGLTADTPLKEAIETWSESVSPEIPVVVLWGDLRENALLDPQTPIGVGGFGRMEAGQALSLMLRSVGAVAAERPIAVIEGSVVTIGTGLTLKPKYQNRIYSVPELTLPPVWISELGGLQGGSIVSR